MMSVISRIIYCVLTILVILSITGGVLWTIRIWALTKKFDKDKEADMLNFNEPLEDDNCRNCSYDETCECGLSSGHCHNYKRKD